MRAKPVPALLLPALAVLLAGFGAGFVWMTHMHHLALPLVADAAAYDGPYESLTATLGVPVNAIGAVLAVALLVYRHPRVPWWLPALGLAVQAAVWFSRLWLWGAWAETVRAEGVRLPDGGPHPAQLDYVDTHWIRIALISGYAVIALATLVIAVVRKGLEEQR
ncbi:hypothetical protein Afil01_15300 [Actinorhabdospora filicis]|uniref:Uncharacterized protein n=1 Tax=Actinorhabdospora filicis TaxID=1785913 RepID=A0A9W6SIP4_9ACTN|nr:hypothetical protein [Actinorhabdospora filicis]GLZ76723.1 hypothetical protein Afil01_15300 [Actinorhabdospora filicis]